MARKIAGVLRNFTGLGDSEPDFMQEVAPPARMVYLIGADSYVLAAGFSDEGLAFLSALRDHNERDWFKPRKATYDDHLKATLDLLVESAAIEGLAAMEAGAIAHMHEDHLDAVRLYAEKLARAGEGSWLLSSFDPQGLDFVDGDKVARLAFEPPLESAAELRPRLVALAKQARGVE